MTEPEPADPGQMASLLDLLDDHRALDSALREVRLAVFEGRGADALAWWGWLVELITVHLDFEDEYLLPRYAELAQHPPNATPRVFANEHARIREAIARVRFDEEPVTCCDRLGRLSGLLEHHDLREADTLKPRLNAALGDEKLALLGTYERLRERVGPMPALEPSGARQRSPRRVGSALQDARAAMAVGDSSAALDALGAMPEIPHPKAERLRARVRDRLLDGDRIGAWDASYLLALACGERPLADA